MSVHRLLAAAVSAVALVALAGCGSSGGGAAPTTTIGVRTTDLPITEQATYEYTVPYGTSIKIDAGQTVNIMPQRLDVKVGESIRIRNEDTRDYMIGVFFVKAGQSLSMRFTHSGTLSGSCQMNPEGEFTIVVADR